MPVRPIRGYKPDSPDERDKHFRTDYLKIGKLHQRLRAFLAPRSVDLRNDPSPPTFDQGSIGSCVDNALATQLGHLTNHTPGAGVEVFSRLFMYGNARGWTNEDSGSSLRDALRGVDKHGVPLEALWPYDVQKWTTRPPQVVWDAARYRHRILYARLDTLAGMKLCLAEGFPFIFGIGVYDTFSLAGRGPRFEVPIPMPVDRFEGGHALCAMGYDDDRKALLFRNSWGTDWGMNGHAWLPYEYVRTSGPLVVELGTPLWYDAWTVRSIPT